MDNVDFFFGLSINNVVGSFSLLIIEFSSFSCLLLRLQVFMMNLSAPFICEFFKDVQEKALP